MAGILPSLLWGLKAPLSTACKVDSMSGSKQRVTISKYTATLKGPTPVETSREPKRGWVELEK